MLPVLLATLLAFFIWLDTDFHHTRQQIESSFKQFTGHNLIMKGGLSLEFWPATRFVSQQVEVIDQRGNVLFTAEKLAAEVNPLSVVKGEWLGENLILDKVQINVVREPLAGDLQSQPQQAPLQGMPFKSIQITDSTVHIDDRINSKRYALSNLQLALELVGDRQMTIKGSLDFNYDNMFTGSSTLSSKLSLGDQLDFEDVVVRLDSLVHDKPLSLKATGAFSLEPDGQLIQIRQAQLASETLALKASFKARQSHDSMVLEAEIDHLNPSAVISLIEPAAVFNQDKVLQTLSAEIDLQQSASEIRIDIPSLELDNSLVQGSIAFSDNIKQFQFKIDELVIDPYLELFAALPLQFDQTSEKKQEEIVFAIQFNRLASSYGALEGLSTKLHLDSDSQLAAQGSFNAKKLNLNGLMKSYKVLLPKNKLISKLHQGNELSLIDGQLQFSLENEALSFSDLDLTIDDTLIKGDIEYVMNPPTLNAQLQLGKLDLDRYHYLLVSEEIPGESSPEDAANTDSLIERLKSLQGSGSIQIEMLRYQQTDYQKIDIQFNDA